jgi:hypothetical protein
MHLAGRKNALEAAEKTKRRLGKGDAEGRGDEGKEMKGDSPDDNECCSYRYGD